MVLGRPHGIYSTSLPCFLSFSLPLVCWPCLRRQGYCVFKLIIKYSSLRDFGFLGKIIGLFLYEDSRTMIFWLVLKLDRVILSWRILFSFRGFSWGLYFWVVKYLPCALLFWLCFQPRALPYTITLGCICIGHKSDSQLFVLLDIVVVPWPFQHMSSK